jgi:hypothetical protein
MKKICPVCGVQGIVQQRGKSSRIQHYQGYIEGKREYSYHKLGSKMEVNPMEVTSLDLSRKAKTVAGGEGFDPTPPARDFTNLILNSFSY